MARAAGVCCNAAPLTTAQRPFTNELLLDGVPNTGTETNSPNNLSFVPSPDATAEFKVQTNLYDAQYGRSGGGVVNVLLKSGSNTFHGTTARALPARCSAAGR